MLQFGMHEYPLSFPLCMSPLFSLLSTRPIIYLFAPTMQTQQVIPPPTLAHFHRKPKYHAVCINKASFINYHTKSPTTSQLYTRPYSAPPADYPSVSVTAPCSSPPTPYPPVLPAPPAPPPTPEYPPPSAALTSRASQTQATAAGSSRAATVPAAAATASPGTSWPGYSNPAPASPASPASATPASLATPLAVVAARRYSFPG